jgi:alpha-L-fucosidase
MLGLQENLTWSLNDAGLKVKAPREKPCEHAYVFKIEMKELP